MADLVINLAARSWKECSETIFSGCPYGDTATRVSGPWLVAGIEWFRPLLGGCVDSTDSRTDRWTKWETKVTILEHDNGPRPQDAIFLYTARLNVALPP